MNETKVKEASKDPFVLDREAEKYVKVTLQLTEQERKDWKQYALNNDMTLTEAIKQAMRLFMGNKSA